MTKTFALAAYLRRIGFPGAAEPTLETLRDLHLRHATSFTFENLNPLLGWPVELEIHALERKMVEGGRGGYCFEQNLLFRQALIAIGFRVKGLAARVLWNQPEDAIPPRGHMLLEVEIVGEPYLADVGFGGQTLTGPLRFEPDIEQATPHEPFRLVAMGDGFKLQSRVGESWKTLYRFDLAEQFLPDYEVSSYYLSTHPSSHFRNSLFVARPAADCRHALFNNTFTVHRLGGGSERRTLATVAELRQVLQEVFELTLPDAAALDTALARFC